ncbi:VOC family protein [Mucilaginibacter sp.]|uniref:VOC family protein n=1 Tax=Mucilaginibacter sp. TaxID=1882438 RepID=UPI000CB2DD38|nr:VOC family protein [Mucilaginibacter sp.]PLW90690.1 MAG: glyoxalase [Mucilaginibacter sp.]PMP65551.1 MAG: glyoxalase [Mucilaginibacter sp.]HEK22319.1 VOC family protein [Bacteroidota bacterium]
MDAGFKAHILPTLTVNNALAAITFYQQAFGAQLLTSNTADGHTVGVLAVEEAQFVVADESPANGTVGPDKQNGVSIRIGLMVSDPDAIAKQAINVGITTVYPVADQDYGYRLGYFIDPFGHHWEIGKPLF